MKRPSPKISTKTATDFRVFTSSSLFRKLLREIIRCQRRCQGENLRKFTIFAGRGKKTPHLGKNISKNQPSGQCLLFVFSWQIRGSLLRYPKIIAKEKNMKVLGIFGSPRRGGNTELLLKEMLRGCRDAQAKVEEIYLRDLKITPCMEIYACRKDGQCPIRDDMQALYPKLIDTDVLALASPIFFYSVSAHAKAFIDRCQAFWAKKYLLHQPVAPGKERRKGVFLSVGGSQGERIFEGALMTMKYFFDSLDMIFYQSLLYRGVDEKGEILRHPTAIAEAYDLGKKLASLS
jgi:multimeric flavodoxin WrbA